MIGKEIIAVNIQISLASHYFNFHLGVAQMR